MAALTAARDTRQLGTGAMPTAALSYKVKGATKPIQGGIAVLNAGFAAPLTVATTLLAIGVFTRTVDNTAGADGAVEATVQEGIFPFDNDGTNPVLNANIGADCFGVDDHTVSILATGRSRVGKVVRIEGSQVFVKIGLGV
jgi:hypothetical protein